MSTRGFPITQAQRASRRKAAEDRKAEYDKLSLQQKLDQLPAGGSKKQRARLEVALHRAQALAPIKETAQSNQQNKKTKKEDSR